jgi:hypothetical protein
MDNLAVETAVIRTPENGMLPSPNATSLLARVTRLERQVLALQRELAKLKAGIDCGERAP